MPITERKIKVTFIFTHHIRFLIPGELITQWHLDRISTDSLIDVIKE